MSVGWSLIGTGGTPTGPAAEWFALRFAHARALVPAANFDTVLGTDFAESVSSELDDVVGVATADPVDFYNGGVVAVSVGDAVIAPSSARLSLTGAPSHVGNLATRPWFMASLVRLNYQDAGALGNTRADSIALWSDDDNGVALGIFGNVPGGSSTNWVGSANLGSSITTVLGPALDTEEGPVWHLFEVWSDGAEVHFMIDGVEFAGTIDAVDVPGTPAQLGPRAIRDAVGDQVITNYDKICVVVASPTVGGTE